MRTIWSIKFYHTGGALLPVRCKIEGPGENAYQAWVNGEGKGKTEAEAYAAAIAGMRGRKPALLS